ncbi:MAG: CehA/McbA family metallohydrolase [Candidatus Bathyarchaeota archaeon]|nr:CehA/McbA family metallohydrolase [Candidatus Bathyarchaeota archaeon]
MQVKADLHVHTVYSNDSVITPKELVFYAKKQGLTAVAITDHNQVEGALKIAKETDFVIIPGIEISSMHGHIVGLNVGERIPRGLSVAETVDRIHEAGGVAVACHPFALLKGSVGKHISSKFDAVETINASAFPFNRATRKATQLAEQLKLPKVAGTDAHYGPVIGKAYTLIRSEESVDAIVKAIAKGLCEPYGNPIPLLTRIENQGRFLWKYFKRSH